MVNLAAVAAFAILAASPAFAGDPRGGGHPGGGACGGGCGGGGHQPPPYTPPPPHGGGFNSNINVNVNANASANAFAGASAGGYFNARAYDVGGIRGRGYGGGTVYVGGGYGGDGGYHGGGAIYNEEVYEGRTCASAPFGYVVSGFGRSDRRAPACVATSVCRDGDDRGGRYGYSERHSCGGGGRQADYRSYEDSRAYGSYRSYESREEYREESSYGGGYGYGGHDGGGSYGGRDCACDHDRGHDTPYPPPYLPEPPRYRPDPAPPARPRPPHRPRPSQPPRQHYSQEPGERG
jgi:hypothetical protein